MADWQNAIDIEYDGKTFPLGAYPSSPHNSVLWSRLQRSKDPEFYQAIKNTVKAHRLSLQEALQDIERVEEDLVRAWMSAKGGRKIEDGGVKAGDKVVCAKGFDSKLAPGVNFGEVGEVYTVVVYNSIDGTLRVAELDVTLYAHRFRLIEEAPDESDQ